MHFVVGRELRHICHPGAITDVVFLAMHRWFGPFAFLVFGAISAAGGVYVYRNLPETKGKTLTEVQALLQALRPETGWPVFAYLFYCSLFHAL